MMRGQPHRGEGREGSNGKKMKVVRDWPRKVRDVEHLWITLEDGCRLAARLWLPEDAERRPVPAILEYLPYRKRDGTIERDELVHPYLAGHGYACLRVDIRGNGDSDGLMEDEYTPQELADGKEVIAWAAAQSWCSGTVGMMGISWGGFNALQVAALRPPALKAIVTMCSTDDRYRDDIHYMGGCLLNDNMTWSAQMLAYSSRPPDPDVVGDDWREMWLRRLEAMPLLAANWLRHQHRDDFWKHGSVCEDFASIEAAVLAVGGWADAYSNAVPRLLAGLKAPALGLMGPWVHKVPHFAYPKPRIGFLQEMLDWWDYWLKGEESDVMATPRYRAYMLHSQKPATHYDEWPGHWISEPAWPSPNIDERSYRIDGRGGLVDLSASGARALEEDLDLCSSFTTGANCGSFCPGMRLGNEFPGDQREEDSQSLVFDTPPLDRDLEIFGAPVVELMLSSDRPVAQLTARICDLHPDGASTRVTFMPFNLAHRESHERPAPLEPGAFYRVRFALNHTAYRFPKGHRIRLALSSAYWPMVWPAPEPYKLCLRTGDSKLTLPVRPARDEPEVTFRPAESSPPLRREGLRQDRNDRRIERDAASGRVTVHTYDDFGAFRIESHGLEVGDIVRQSFSIVPDDPCSARAEASWTYTIGRGPWQTRTESVTRMWSDRTAFHLEANLKAFEGDELVFEKDWRESVDRDLV